MTVQFPYSAVTAKIPYSHETELNEVLEHCNAVRMAPVPDADSLPEGFTGTLVARVIAFDGVF